MCKHVIPAIKTQHLSPDQIQINSVLLDMQYGTSLHSISHASQAFNAFMLTAGDKETTGAQVHRQQYR